MSDTLTELRPVLLLVESRRQTFVDSLLGRDDVTIVLLRLGAASDRGANLDGADCEVFELDATVPLEREAARFRAWTDEIGVHPSYFCNPNEAVQPVAQAFAAAAGLPHLTPEQVSQVHDKPAMKALYHSIGLPCAPFALVDTVAEIEAFGGEHGWPVILKPIDSDSCIGTWKLTDRDLDLAARELAGGRRWMVERYVSGQEFQLCALVAGGRVLDAYVSTNPAPILDVLEGAINANITLAPSQESPIDALSLCQQLVDGVGYDSGYLHGEFWLTDTGFVMGELAARLSGCEVPLNHGLSYGFDIMAAITDLYIGKTPTLTYSADRSVGDLLLPVSAGLVTEMSSEDELLALEGVISCDLRAAVGDELDPPRASFACSGVVQVEGRDSDQVAARMREVLRVYRFAVR